MEWSSMELDQCPVVRALEVLGGRWTLILLREGFNGVHRFEDLQRHLGVSPSMLSKRLKDMVDDGLLDRVPYREPGDRERYEYRPTDKAWELYPVIVGLMQWGNRHLGTGAPSVELVDAKTGSPVVAALVPATAPTYAPDDVRVVLDPADRATA